MKKTDIKLSFMDTKFIENGPATICKIQCMFKFPLDSSTVSEIVQSRFPLVKTEYSWEYGTDICRFEVVGISKLHDNDINNSIIGKRISESRAKQKAYELIARILSVISDRLDNMCQQCDNSAFIFSGLMSTEEDHIEELIDWAEEYDNLKKCVEQQMTTSQIASKYNCSLETIERGLKFVGLLVKFPTYFE